MRPSSTRCLVMKSLGIAFNEASGACLTRVDGNDPGGESAMESVTRNAQSVAAGHTFYIAMRDGYPINQFSGAFETFQKYVPFFAPQPIRWK